MFSIIFSTKTEIFHHVPVLDPNEKKKEKKEEA